ncbi:MAG: rRNA maturation RNase YbeY [Erysipelotrichaceae bacterium]|nr:rRNA maturation RNase YbeY [Erysipelotrichaceae bacterium]MDD3809974.1 rRNA maturation RNase YbeY [Erysipelotrichaceae bacterium]
MEIDLALINQTEKIKEDYSKDLHDIVAKTCEILDIDEDLELSCIIVSTDKIHEINKEYRHLDKPTDVISFALEDSEQIVGGGVRVLGDIFICDDYVINQAQEYGHSLRREFCFLFTHGLLHLLGYDHMNEEEEKEMIGLQKKILDNLEIKRG